jgi:hypothetical protein
MRYSLNEGYLELPGQWLDRSVNALLPAMAEVTGSNLVLTRDELPYGVPFADYVEVQKAKYRNELVGLQVQRDEAGELDGRPCHFFDFTWRKDDLPIHQMAVIVLDAPLVLALTYTSPGQLPGHVRETIGAALASFTFHRGAQQPAQ